MLKTGAGDDMVIVAASNNAGKIKEFNALLGHLGIRVLPISEMDGNFHPEETGSSFRENALIKAREAAQETGLPALADDSGLEVDVLDGRPGIWTSRYAGDNPTDDENNQKLLDELKPYSLAQRTARFHAVAALVLPDGQEFTSTGKLEGVILDECKGTCGFGYDPLFYIPELKKTMAELTLEEKNQISHRARAFSGLVHTLKGLQESIK